MGRIDVEVVFALPRCQTIIALELEEGATVRDAIVRSGILDAHPELALESCEVSVWGKISVHDRTLRDRDRVEVCRALVADPKTARRQRAGNKRG
jgi:putative ubiquitin-RnfH superfamily antitoxin RatB of RatAB toxin-antitoxin module